MIKEAIQNRASFNLIHLETAIKIDVFILKDIPYHQECQGQSYSPCGAILFPT